MALWVHLARPSRLAVLLIGASAGALFARTVAFIRSPPELALLAAAGDGSGRPPSPEEPSSAFAGLSLPHGGRRSADAADGAHRSGVGPGCDGPCLAATGGLEDRHARGVAAEGAAPHPSERSSVASAPASPLADAPTARLATRRRHRLGDHGSRKRLCADGEAPRLDRDLLHGSFRQLSVRGWSFLADPQVTAERAAPALEGFRDGIQRLLDGLGPSVATVPVPRLVLYDSQEQLVASSCVNPAALGYYDGDLHAVADAQLVATVAHELTHHVLDRLGVASPSWLHEGLAMVAARERWWRAPGLGLEARLLAEPLPFEALTDGFSQAATPSQAGLAYFQSYAMVRFLLEREAADERPEPVLLGELVTHLANGAVRPEEAFAWAARLDGRRLDEAFRRFVQQRLSPRGR